MSDKIKISFEDAVAVSCNDDIILKRRDNGFLLNDYQINVLSKNGINYLNYSNIKDLLFDIEDFLDCSFDEELDLVSSQIAEYIYYSGRQ